MSEESKLLWLNANDSLYIVMDWNSAIMEISPAKIPDLIE